MSIAKDPGLPAIRVKPLEPGTCFHALVALGLELGGVILDCNAETPNDPSSATRPTRVFDCNLDAKAGFAAAHG